MIRLVVALRAEARPLIRRFALQRDAAAEGAIWRTAGVSLAICGIGHRAAAAATARLADEAGAAGAVWLNVGIAGHRALAVGEIVLAGRVVSARDGRSWRPRPVSAPPCAIASVTTVDRPELEYPEDTVYEMEAAGFCAALERRLPQARMQVVKVISDNAGAPPTRLTVSGVEELIERRVATIVAIAELAGDARRGQ